MVREGWRVVAVCFFKLLQRGIRTPNKRGDCGGVGEGGVLEM